VFDYAYSNNETGQTVNKLVFVNWAPDESSTRTKVRWEWLGSYQEAGMAV
jgi:hypothetical protein